MAPPTSTITAAPIVTHTPTPTPAVTPAGQREQVSASARCRSLRRRRAEPAESAQRSRHGHHRGVGCIERESRARRGSRPGARRRGRRAVLENDACGRTPPPPGHGRADGETAPRRDGPNTRTGSGHRTLRGRSAVALDVSASSMPALRPLQLLQEFRLLPPSTTAGREPDVTVDGDAVALDGVGPRVAVPVAEVESCCRVAVSQPRAGGSVVPRDLAHSVSGRARASPASGRGTES